MIKCVLRAFSWWVTLGEDPSMASNVLVYTSIVVLLRGR